MKCFEKKIEERNTKWNEFFGIFYQNMKAHFVKYMIEIYSIQFNENSIKL